jgi:ATPase subunit of ABC transporter with duplicated ATPase domains
MAMDVGHGYGLFQEDQEKMTANIDSQAEFVITKRKGFLFDCVDLCINEGQKYCLMGNNASGKSSLLRLLAKREEPLEGSVHHAQRVQVGYFGQETMDQLMNDAGSDPGVVVTSLSYLAKRFPNKTDKDLRGSLTDFGLGPQQAAMDIRFLSGGERCRLCLASLMLENPHVLCLDNPTTNLDVESVEALVYGLLHWKDGTVVMVSHDSNLVRQLDANCAALMEEEGKLRRIDGSIDDYLKAFWY